MKTSSKIAIAAAAVGAYLCIHKKKGIGWVGRYAYASRNKLAPYFNGDYLISKVVVIPENARYDLVTIYFYGRMPVEYLVSKEDIKWLSDLCERLREDIIFED